MKRLLPFAIAFVLLGIGTAPSLLPAQQPAAPATMAPSGSNPDIAFYQQALAGGVREILLSRQAMSQSGSAGVRSLASMLVSDHTTMDQELADAGHLSEPSPTAADLKEAANQQRMSGALFNSTYLAAMERDHKRALELFNDAMLHGHDSTARNLATTGLQSLHRHLTEIQTQQHRGAGE